MLNRRNITGVTGMMAILSVAIALLLSALMFIAISSSRTKAHDAKRKADLLQLKKAMELYYDKNSTYSVSGTGRDGTGEGWMALENGAEYKKSVIRGLQEAGFLAGGEVEDPIQRPGYMIFLCDGGQRFAISTTLASPEPNDIAFAKTVCNAEGKNGSYTKYEKNFAVTN